MPPLLKRRVAVSSSLLSEVVTLGMVSSEGAILEDNKLQTAPLPSLAEQVLSNG